MSLYLQPLKKYATFSGRASRKEYWSFYLFYILAILGGGVLGVTLATLFADVLFTATCFLIVIAGLGTMIPSLAVGVRRLHDKGMSGWFMLIGLIPFIGGIVLLIMYCLPGDIGANDYGPDPRELGE
jgi:uncharacterized membrane protein YhaH (DUF805 family)